MVRRNQSLLDDALRGATRMLASLSGWRRRQLPAKARADCRTDALERISEREFESLVAAAFRREGFLVVERGGRGLEGGVDLEMYLGRDRYLVQCGQWRATKVGVDVLRVLFAVMRAERAVGCFIVTSGSFTDEARAFATGRAIRLVPAESLRPMTAGLSGPDEGAASSNLGSNLSPACPQCGRAMISRIVQRGESRGLSFWGCSGFPLCRGVRVK